MRAGSASNGSETSKKIRKNIHDCLGSMSVTASSKDGRVVKIMKMIDNDENNMISPRDNPCNQRF